MLLEKVSRNFSKSIIFYPIVFILFFSFLLTSPLSGMLEADTYFHFALSKMTAEQGIVKSLVQLEDIGWNTFFVDKEFLFHQYTSLAFRIWGESGVVFSCQLLAAAILTIMVFVSTNFCSKAIAFLLTVLCILNVNFIYRLVLVRPHLLGILLALIILQGLLSKNKWVLGISSMLFPLAYHAFYIPIMFMGAFLLTARFKNIKFIIFFGILPIIVGLLVNPYFPGNIVLAYMHLKIAFSQGASYVGLDTKSKGFVSSMDCVGPYIVLFSFLVFKIKNAFKENVELVALLLISLILCILYFSSPRTLEYLIPVTAILSASTIAYFRGKVTRYPQILCLLLLAISVRYIGHFSIRARVTNERSNDMLSLVSKLPNDKPGKVFNCEWENGAYIFYARPNLKLIDLLDPNFIFLHNADLARAKETMLLNGQETTYKLLTEVFKANYILCFNPYVIQYLSQNPRYQKLAEGETNPKTILYQILRD
jgi:hypothetical protein